MQSAKKRRKVTFRSLKETGNDETKSKNPGQAVKRSTLLKNNKADVVSEQESVLHDLKEYFNYKNSITDTADADSDDASGAVIEDEGSNNETATDSDNSSDDEELKSDRLSRKGRRFSGRKDNVSRNFGNLKRPAPNPPLAPTTKKSRFYADNGLDQPGPAKSLAQLLRTRTSLYPAQPGAQEQLNSSIPTFKVLGKAFEYVKKRNAMEKWAVNLRSMIKEEPEKVLRDHFFQLFVSKLRKQMQKEWFYWAEVGRDGGNRSEYYSCWKTMLHRFVSLHPTWMKHTDELEFKDLLEDAGFSCLLNVDKLISRNNKIVGQIRSWRSSVEASMENKLVFMKKFRGLEVEIENKDKKLDEYCHWGKKQLQSSFMAPYFKISSMDYTNLVPPTNFLDNLYGDALLTQKKQKWTTKDVKALKKIIVDVILDKEYAALMERYNYLTSKITYERTLRLEGSNQKCSLGLEQPISDECMKTTRRVNMKKRTGSDLSFATIQRVIPTNIVGFHVKALYSVKGMDVQKWFQENESAFRRLNYDTLMKEDKYIKQIDWFKVAERLTVETGKDRCSKNCRLVWLHDARPEVSNKKWPAVNLKKLMELGPKGGKTMSWQDIANEIEGKTPYQCFYRYRNRVVQTNIMTWDEEKDQRVNDVLLNEGPKWGKAVEATVDPRATKHQVQERWKKFSNPILRNGAFTRVEDALLILSIEKLRGFLQKEGHFGILMAYLPWRFETVWCDRANNLFSNWIIPWTIDEDRKLLTLVKSQKGRKNWTEISQQFTSFKNRKGCLTRHKILLSKIGGGSGKFKTLEEYHEAYSMTRYNVFQYKHLREVIGLLKRVAETHSPGTFGGFSKERPPTELELRWMLLDYDKAVVKSAVQSLERYVITRDKYWKEWMDKNGQIKKTFDRRSFHREDPKSVASAIHIRGLKLIPKDGVVGSELTSFESDVYFHFARFSRTKALKGEVKRPYLPSAKQIRRLPEIKRLIAPFDHEDSESESDSNNGSSFEVKKRRSRKKSVTVFTSKKQRGKESKKEAGKIRSSRSRSSRSHSSANEIGSSEEAVRGHPFSLRKPRLVSVKAEGLYPPETSEKRDIPRKKRGRPPKSERADNGAWQGKRKRGLSIKNTDIASPSKRKDRPPEHSTSHCVAVSSNLRKEVMSSEVEVVKRKRGRPRKSQGLIIHVETGKSACSPIRPASQCVDVSSDARKEVMSSEVVVVKRKRGRPRKSQEHVIHVETGKSACSPLRPEKEQQLTLSTVTSINVEPKWPRMEQLIHVETGESACSPLRPEKEQQLTLSTVTPINMEPKWPWMQQLPPKRRKSW